MIRKTVDFVSQCFFKVLIIVDAIIYHTYVCYNNGQKLFHLLLRGTRTWVIMLVRLMLFTCLLAPGWYKLLRYWFLSPLIIRNLRYGKGAKNRNLLDVYLPVPQKQSKSKGASKNGSYNNSFSHKSGAPVVIFVSGGAWTIGYKLWSALVARGLARLGILTIVPDYRNFPQGDVEDMMEDIRLSVEWTVANAHRFGGDSDKIVLSGQSAGAHITLCLLVADYMRQQQELKRSASSRASCSAGDSFLADTADSGSEIYEEDSESEVAEDEEEAGHDESHIQEDTRTASAAGGAAEAGEMSDLTVELNATGALSIGTVPSSDYYTPLKDGAQSSKGAFVAGRALSPAVALQGASRDGAAEARHRGHSPGRKRSHSHTPSQSGSQPGSRRNSKSLQSKSKDEVDTPIMSGSHHSVHRHHSGRKLRSRSIGGGSENPHHEHSAASILDIIDTYLDANISHSGQHDSTGTLLTSATASTLKRKFHEQLRRNNHIGGTEFDVPGIDGSGVEDVGDTSEEEVRVTEEVRGACVEEVEEEEPPLWRDVPSARKVGVTDSPRAEFLSAFSPVPAAATAIASVATPATPALALNTPVVPSASSSTAAYGVNRNFSPRRVAAKPVLAKNSKTARRTKFNAVAHIKLFIGVSGPYNLSALESHFHQRGLDSSILSWICRGDIPTYSPTAQLAEYAERVARETAASNGDKTTQESDESPQSPFTAYHPSAALSNLTPIALFHGSRDASIPVSICTELSDVLQAHGANVLCKIYEGWSHTDAILEAPLSGTMRLFHDMAGVIFAHTAHCSSNLGSTNSINGLPATERLTLPEAADPAENDSYSCSPLDYVSLFLFPKFFGGNTAADRTSAPQVPTQSTEASEDSSAAPSRAPRTVGGQMAARAKGKAAAKEGAGKNTAMVSQLLVKIAREVNPF